MMSGKEGIWMKKNAEYMLEHAGLCRAADRLEPQMFDEYGVQRGLRGIAVMTASNWSTDSAGIISDSKKWLIYFCSVSCRIVTN